MIGCSTMAGEPTQPLIDKGAGGLCLGTPTRDEPPRAYGFSITDMSQGYKQVAKICQLCKVP